ncbi:MAG: hypothetical protein SFU53_16020 [Terrimicrobiaceae bacterium]|nr:hypothetical protein [Terrimicrobiaceae bacterium]
MTVPTGFRHRIAQHNRHAWLAAGLSLIGAWLAWMLAYGLVVGVALGFLTIVHGQDVILGDRLMQIPAWLHFAAAGLALILLIWGAVEQARSRFRPADDRPVIGWHLAADLLLAAPRLTFAIWTNLGSVIRLSRDEMSEAFALLAHIHEIGRAPVSSLGAYFPDLRRLRRELTALQLAGWVDLHHAEPEPFYLVRSSESEEVRELVQGPCESADEDSEIRET